MSSPVISTLQQRVLKLLEDINIDIASNEIVECSSGELLSKHVREYFSRVWDYIILDVFTEKIQKGWM